MPVSSEGSRGRARAPRRPESDPVVVARLRLRLGPAPSAASAATSPSRRRRRLFGGEFLFPAAVFPAAAAARFSSSSGAPAHLDLHRVPRVRADPVVGQHHHRPRVRAGARGVELELRGVPPGLALRGEHRARGPVGRHEVRGVVDDGDPQRLAVAVLAERQGRRVVLPRTTAPPTRGVRRRVSRLPLGASPPPGAAGGSAAAAPRESLTVVVHVTTSNSRSGFRRPSRSCPPNLRGARRARSTPRPKPAPPRPAAASAAARFSRRRGSRAARAAHLASRASASATFSSTAAAAAAAPCRLRGVLGGVLGVLPRGGATASDALRKLQERQRRPANA